MVLPPTQNPAGHGQVQKGVVLFTALNHIERVEPNGLRCFSVSSAMSASLATQNKITKPGYALDEPDHNMLEFANERLSGGLDGI